MPDLAAFRRQTIARSVEDGDGAGDILSVDAVVRRTDRQIGEVVAVEIAGRERAAEVVKLVRLTDAGGVRAPDLDAVSRQAVFGAIEHGDSTAFRHTVEALQRHSNGEIGKSVAVEV